MEGGIKVTRLPESPPNPLEDGDHLLMGRQQGHSDRSSVTPATEARSGRPASSSWIRPIKFVAKIGLRFDTPEEFAEARSYTRKEMRRQNVAMMDRLLGRSP